MDFYIVGLATCFCKHFFFNFVSQIQCVCVLEYNDHFYGFFFKGVCSFAENPAALDVLR